MIRGGRLFVAIALGVLIVAASAWWLTSFRRVERWVDLPARGEAVYNPLYALKVALRNDGQAAESRQRLDQAHLAFGVHDTVLVYSDPRALGAAQLDGLFAFAARGGHLVLRMPPYDFRPGLHRIGPLAQHLPLQPFASEPECLDLRLDDGKKQSMFCAAARFRIAAAAHPLLAWGTPGDGDVFARFGLGDGTVDLWSDLRFLENRALPADSNARLARQLLAPRYGQGTFHLVYAADMPPLWRLLLDNAWMALVPLLLSTLGWLWMRSQRLGPLLPPAPHARRALIEHVRASGEHLLRYGRVALLHRAVRDAVIARMRRRHPLAAALAGDAQAAALAARVGIPARELIAILSTRPPVGAREFHLRISQLIDLRTRL